MKNVKITESERDEMLSLYNKGQKLQSDSASLTTESGELMDKIVSEMVESSEKSQEWWERILLKYQLETSIGEVWKINFETCEIFLENPEN